MAFAQGDGGLLQMNQSSFDFNLPFEQLFFSIIPSALFIVSSVWRTIFQARKPAIVNAPVFQLIKLVQIPALYGSIQVGCNVMLIVVPLHRVLL